MNSIKIIFAIGISLLFGNDNPIKNNPYISAYKRAWINAASNQIETNIQNKTYLVGAVHFQFENNPYIYVASEAPYNLEGFLNLMMDNDLGLYVTLTDDDDNHKAKLRILRGTIDAPIDIHHWDKIWESKSALPEYLSVNRVINIEDDFIKIVKISIENKRNHKHKELYHIQYKHWPDKTAIPATKLSDLVEKIYQYMPHAQKGIFVNCFMGVGRTRALLMAMQMRYMWSKGETFVPAKISKEYFYKNYNLKTQKSGEFIHDYIIAKRHKKIRQTQFDMLLNYEQILSNRSTNQKNQQNILPKPIKQR